jgi:hypothetical protein
MSSYDLNLSNYSVEDLYSLFKLNINDQLDDFKLKSAKRIVLLSHPDKSRLPPEYFHFFTKAYKMLEQIAVINKKTTRETYYVRDLDNYNEEIHQTMNRVYQNDLNSGKSEDQIKKEFNETFNREFEKINQDILPQNRNGYEDWLKANDPQLPLENHKEYFQKKKQELSERERYALSKYGVQDVIANSGTMPISELVGEPSEYTSEMFSSLSYTDLKKSYTEQFVPVTDDDYNSKRKYNNVDELIQERGGHVISPPTREQHQEMLNKKHSEEETQSINRAYVLAMDYEKAKTKNAQFSKQFFNICN